MLVLGEKEKEMLDNSVSVRRRHKGDLGKMNYDDFLQISLENEINTRKRG